MAILVSGGAGYIGSHTCIELLNAGYDVVVADNFYNASPVVLDRVKQITGKDFRFYNADMTKHEDVEKIFTECPDITAVIQFAAYKAVGESVSKPIEYYYNNLNCTLVILDVMLPDISGFTLCGEIRKEHHFPVLMLTAKAEDMDKITGLTIGADDYITKPFNPLELMARVKAQLRRYTRYNEADKAGDCRDIIDFNGLVINRATHECTLYDRELGLTPIEFDILWMLCENRGQVISAERLFESVWGEKYLDRNNTVMVHIRRLREKMGEPSRNPRFIKTVWGVGYKID